MARQGLSLKLWVKMLKLSNKPTNLPQFFDSIYSHDDPVVVFTFWITRILLLISRYFNIYFISTLLEFCKTSLFIKHLKIIIMADLWFLKLFENNMIPTKQYCRTDKRTLKYLSYWKCSAYVCSGIHTQNLPLYNFIVESCYTQFNLVYWK